MRALLRMTACLVVLTPVALVVAASVGAVTITSAGYLAGTNGNTIQARNVGTASEDPYCSGTIFAIAGTGFVSEGGVKSVMLGGVPAAVVTIGSDERIYAQAGRGATSGPIVVTTNSGTSFSTDSLPGGRLNAGDTSIQGQMAGVQIVPCVSHPTIVKPAVTGIKPNPSKGGRKVQLNGSGFSGVSKVTVGGVAAAFAVAQDQNIILIVPKTAKNGKLPVVLTNSAGTVTSTVSLVKKG